MTRKSLMTLLLLPFILPLAGCGAGTPSVDTVRWEIERRLPEARFERESHIRLGRITLGLARRIVHLADPGDPDVAPLDDIRRIEVATYRVRSLPDLDRLLTTQTAFEKTLAENGWTMALRERGRDTRTWMFLRFDSQEKLSNLYVVALEPDELTLVRLDGRLDRAMAESIADHPKELMKEVGGEEGKGAR
jgi:hypothetical protein